MYAAEEDAKACAITKARRIVEEQGDRKFEGN